MSSISYDCPYCGSMGAAFELLMQSPSKARKAHWDVMVECGVCKERAIVEFRDRSPGSTPNNPIEWGQSAQIHEKFGLTAFVPEPVGPRIASDLPKNVERPLEEAERAYSSRLYSGAASCYRKALERAVRTVNPEGSGMLNARIRQVEEDGLLPPSMIELLDQVRLFGNASMHEDEDDPTKGECEAARDFAHLFLTYTFSLPAMIARAKGDTED